MGFKTGISWTDHTFNIVWGCTKISPGCLNCYADRDSKRYGFDIWGPDKPRRTFGEKYWNNPLRWNKKAVKDGVRRRVFCSSMCDIFEDHETVKTELAKLWPLIGATPQLDWLLLTKRIDRALECLPDDWGGGYPNAWVGTTIENNDYAWRADHLRKVPAVVRFVSYEPAVGPLDMPLDGIDWMIFGGESGADGKRREQEDIWPRSMRDRCRASGTAFWHKQSSGRKSGEGVELDGKSSMSCPCPGGPHEIRHLQNPA